MPRRLYLLILAAIPAVVSAAADALRFDPDIVYSRIAGTELKLDITRPANAAGPLPAVVYFHGGGWQAGRRQDSHGMIRRLAGQGFVGISVSYRFAPQFPWPAQVHDAKTAVRYIRAHAREWGIDPDRIAAAGDSAGGYLALMLGVTGPADGLEGDGEWADTSSRVQAVISYYSAADFTVRVDDTTREALSPEEEKRRQETEAIFQAYFRKSGRQVLAEWAGTDDPAHPVWKRLSPVTYIGKGDAPVLILQGDRDTVVPVRQAHLLARTLADAGVPHELVIVPGGGHGFTGEQRAVTDARALAFLQKWLGSPAPEAAAKSPVSHPAPSLVDVPYGPHERNTLDLWLAGPPSGRTPLLIYIHGGGFTKGDKSKARSMRLIRQCLDAGISFATINYRYVDANVPLQDVLRDCALAVQYLRSRSGEWGLDRTRFAACGHSAGAGTSLWLAFHDDMADPTSDDPVKRESTRLACAVSWEGQYTYDLRAWGSLFGEEARRRFGGRYNSPALYGLATEEEINGPEGLRRRQACDFYGMISPDDPPVYLSASLPTAALDDVNQYLHHPRHTLALYERCQEKGVKATARIPAFGIEPSGDHPTAEQFLLAYLKTGVPPGRN